MQIRFKFEPIHPRAFKGDELNKQLFFAMKEFSRKVMKDFHTITRTWRHKPKFTNPVARFSTGISVTVMTNDTIFGWVNAGTGWYKGKMAGSIAPKSAGKLVYPKGGKKALLINTGYMRKTSAMTKSTLNSVMTSDIAEKKSMTTGVTSRDQDTDEDVETQFVAYYRWYGMRPRNFDLQMYKRWQPQLEGFIADYMAKTIRKMGYEM